MACGGNFLRADKVQKKDKNHDQKHDGVRQI